MNLFELTDLMLEKQRVLKRPVNERVCIECERVFDLTDDAQASEWWYGHDCREDN